MKILTRFAEFIYGIYLGLFFIIGYPFILVKKVMDSVLPKSFKMVDKAYKVTDDYWYRMFIANPLTKPIVYFFVKLGINANLITLISFFFYILSALLFAGGSLVIGALFAMLGFFFDCMDGNVARLQNKSSFFGYWFDGTIDQIAIFIIVCGLSYHLGPQYLYLAIFFVIIPFNIFYRSALLIGRKEDKFSSDNKNIFWAIDTGWVSYLYKKMKSLGVSEPFGFFEVWMFLTVLFPIVGLPFWGIGAFFIMWVPLLAIRTLFYFTGKFTWRDIETAKPTRLNEAL